MKYSLMIYHGKRKSRPRKGAWIEIELSLRWQVTRARRPRKGAWIEITLDSPTLSRISVAPARGRGLKSDLACRNAR